MPVFTYKAVREDGTSFTEEAMAADAGELRRDLEGRGYLVLSLAKKKTALRGGASTKDFLLFNQEFATLVKAGLPILQALEILHKRTEKPGFRSALEGIIHDNLSYIKEVAPQLSDGDLNHVAQDILTLYEDELAQRRITVVKELAKALPPLAFDQQQMKQAVINIIKNAMEAMENGGTLTISTSYLPDTNEESFEIGDTGHGISAKAMHNVFNPYYTTKPRGTGLGLPITNRIVKAHGGRIEMRNKSTGGAVFTIKLPRGGIGGRET
jgi:signal transduction histidine kinase